MRMNRGVRATRLVPGDRGSRGGVEGGVAVVGGSLCAGRASPALELRAADPVDDGAVVLECGVTRKRVSGVRKEEGMRMEETGGAEAYRTRRNRGSTAAAHGGAANSRLCGPAA